MTRITSLLQCLSDVRNRTEAHLASLEHLLHSLFVMAWMVEARDPYTGGHLWRVSQYSKVLAQRAGLTDADVARISVGGFLHDLGKIGVPDAILRKAGQLTDEEFAVIKTHPEVGVRLLSEHPLAPLADKAVLYHHERVDGLGYPSGLASVAIPLDARIVSICDAFDAMTSARPYRLGIGTTKALAVIEEALNTQFDQQLAVHFLTIGHEGSLDHIVGHSDHGIPMQECPICGPTIVVRRNQHSGDSVFCRNCGNEAIVSDKGGKIIAIPTGMKGDIKDLEAVPDLDVIGELVKAAAMILSKE